MHHPVSRGTLILLSEELKQWRQWWRWQWEWPKTNTFDKQNNNFACASRFFVHFFAVTPWLRHAKRPNFMFTGGREQTTTFFFFSYTLTQSFRIQPQKKNANIWQIEQDGISVIKFGIAQIHSLVWTFL